MKEWAESEGIPVLGEIPYDRAIPNSMSMLRPFVEAFPDSKAAESIRDIAERIRDEILE